MTVADKTQDNLNMSAVFNMMRQTKARKSKSVCRVQLAEADKRQEILKLSAGFSLMRQTEIAKQAVRLPGTAYCCRQKARNSKSVCRIQPDAADRNSKTGCLSAGYSKARQTEIAKQADRLPGSATIQQTLIDW